ncbi:hypothetical protein E2C01_046851 [Portunus trituberculatus]|uniref:Uncharacterized protein n=1 Tax=Portunus trituberculatus TaxID=210409 RepID=A0A5B7G5X5_PORTR|nr:hypothetical protein [Portunus trituberculatus]
MCPSTEDFWASLVSKASSSDTRTNTYTGELGSRGSPEWGGVGMCRDAGWEGSGSRTYWNL